MLQPRQSFHGVWRAAQRASALMGQWGDITPSDRSWSSRTGTSSSTSTSGTHNSGMCLSRLPSRGVVRMVGKEALEFLQGLVTNDVTPLEVPGGPPVYAALLSPKGKYLHDAFIYSISGDHLLLDVDAASTPNVIKWLARYRLRRHIDIADATQEYAVWVHYGDPSTSPGPGQAAIASAADTAGAAGTAGTAKTAAAAAAGAAGTAAAPAARSSAMAEELAAASGCATAGAAARAAEAAAADTSATAGTAGTAAAAEEPSPGWHPDQRLPELGFRALLHASTSEPAAGLQVGDDRYRWLRYQLGVAEGDTEIASGKAAPQEYNLDALHGISYTKGCYVGQERTSFTHHRGIIRKRLMPIRLEGSTDQGSIVGADVQQEGNSGRSIGTIVAAQGDVGLAHLRLAPALAAAAGNAKLLAGTDGVQVVPERPHWWPAEWGLEEGQ